MPRVDTHSESRGVPDPPPPWGFRDEYITGEERHAFPRATKQKEKSLEPLLKTVRTQTVLKDALWHIRWECPRRR